MKQLRYTGPATPPIALPTVGVVSDDRGVVEVPDDVAKSLLEQDTWESTGGKAPTIAALLKEANANPARAVDLLAAEQATDKPRPTLVAGLNEIIQAHQPDPESGPGDAADQAQEV